MTFCISHCSSTMVPRCLALVAGASLFAASVAASGNGMAKFAHGGFVHPSLPSVPALSSNINLRPPPATHPQSPLLATTLASVAAPAPPLATRRVVLYGDSLAWEAQVPFRAALNAAGINQVLTRTFGGTAICDWLPQMRADQARLHPDAVVIEFSGDAFTPCMQDVAGHSLSGAAYFDEYGDDARTAVGIFASDDTLVYFAGSPISRGAEQSHAPDAGRLNHIYASIASADQHTRYIDAGASVLDHGRWTGTLPCLPEEPCTGGTDPAGHRVNIVRAPDGNHFCPHAPPAVRGVTDSCPVWSSGAYRYGTAMADPVIVDLTPISRPAGRASS